MADERDEIRARINIVDLVGQSVLLKKAGKSWKGLCPFHADKNPSFTVDPTFGTYRCWSCGEHGDVFTWVMKTRHVEFVEALQMLAELAGVTLAARGPTPSKDDRARWNAAMKEALAFFREQLKRSEQAKAYCERRGLSPEILAEWEVGYAPDVGEALAIHLKKKGHSLAECRELFLVEVDGSGGFFDKFRGRLMFPIRSENSDLVAFGGRVLGDGIPKYINSSDTPLYRKSRVLYAMNRAKDAIAKSGRAVLVEGYLDVIACHASEVKEAVASLGTSMTEDQAKLLKRWCQEVVILYDSDAAGQKAADRAVEILQAEGLRARVALMPPGEDPDTLLRTVGAAAVRKAAETGLRPVDYKFRKLLATRKPEEDEFWVEAIEIISASTTEMELDRYIVQLAAISPGATDAVSAQRALRRQVARFRKAKKTAPAAEEAPRAMNPFRSMPLDPSEIVIFRALLEPEFKQLAWDLCGDASLFTSPVGRSLAEAIRAAYPDRPPGEKPSIWVQHLSEDMRDTFVAAQYDLRVEPKVEGRSLQDARTGRSDIRTRPFSYADMLEGAIQRLRNLRANRELEVTKAGPKDDQRLVEFLNRLKERQRTDNSEA